MTLPFSASRPFDRKRLLLTFYLVESLIGAALGYGVFCYYPTLGIWCLISIVLVLAPDRQDAVKLAKNRIKANLVGAAIGLALFFLHPPNLVMIGVGWVAAILICEWLKLQAATRTAVVAVLIITLHEPGKFFWQVAAERAGGVVLGCVIGVIITFGFHQVVRRFDAEHPRLP